MQRYTFTKKITGIAKSHARLDAIKKDNELKNKGIIRTIHLFKSREAIKKTIAT